MKNKKPSPCFFTLFDILIIIIACSFPFLYLYMEDEQKINGFKYFTNNFSWNILMIFSLVCLLLSVFFSLLAIMETKIYEKRKQTEIGLSTCLLATFLYVVYAFTTLQGNQTTLAPFALFFAFLVFAIYNILIDFI